MGWSRARQGAPSTGNHDDRHAGELAVRFNAASPPPTMAAVIGAVEDYLHLQAAGGPRSFPDPREEPHAVPVLGHFRRQVDKGLHLSGTAHQPPPPVVLTTAAPPSTDTATDDELAQLAWLAEHGLLPDNVDATLLQRARAAV